MQTRPFIAAVVAVTFIAWRGFGPCALAANLGLDFTNGGTERNAIANSNYGWSFRVTSPLTIDGLGLWDAGSNGLVEPHEVGLWLTSTPIPEGVLVASTTVSNEAKRRRRFHVREWALALQQCAGGYPESRHLHFGRGLPGGADGIF